MYSYIFKEEAVVMAIIMVMIFAFYNISKEKINYKKVFSSIIIVFLLVVGLEVVSSYIWYFTIGEVNNIYLIYKIVSWIIYNILHIWLSLYICKSMMYNDSKILDVWKKQSVIPKILLPILILLSIGFAIMNHFYYIPQEKAFIESLYNINSYSMVDMFMTPAPSYTGSIFYLCIRFVKYLIVGTIPFFCILGEKDNK